MDARSWMNVNACENQFLKVFEIDVISAQMLDNEVANVVCLP